MYARVGDEGEKLSKMENFWFLILRKVSKKENLYLSGGCDSLFFVDGGIANSGFAFSYVCYETGVVAWCGLICW